MRGLAIVMVAIGAKARLLRGHALLVHLLLVFTSSRSYLVTFPLLLQQVLRWSFVPSGMMALLWFAATTTRTALLAAYPTKPTPQAVPR